MAERALLHLSSETELSRRRVSLDKVNYRVGNLSCSRRTWNLCGLGLAYPFPRSFPHHVPDSQAALRFREDRHRQAVPRRADPHLRPVR